MPCCDICKGLCFFFYLPLLPLWWTLEFLWEYGRRKWRRSKRKKRYRALKASQVEKAKDQYLSVDQYTRGKVEKQILGLNNKIKKARHKNRGVFAYSLSSQWMEFLYMQGTGVALTVNLVTPVTKTRFIHYLSQCVYNTLTPDLQAVDIDELLNPGHPVFFNYANITKAPSSLKVFMLTTFVLFH